MPRPLDEKKRLAALLRYALLDTPPEAPLDDLTGLAAHICQAPIALISLVDEQRQWLKSKVGWDGTEIPRDAAFCAHTIRQAGLLIVADARADERFAKSPLVVGRPHIRFYAGVPLVTPKGHALGTLCVMDRVPRELSAGQKQVLLALSRQAMALFELRPRRPKRANSASSMARVKEDLRLSERRIQALLENSIDGLALVDAQGVVLFSPVNSTANILGYGPQELVGRSAFDFIHRDDLASARERLGELLRLPDSRVSAEFRFRRRDGTWRWLESIGRNLLKEPGIHAVIISYRDATQRRQAQAALETKTAQLQAVTEAMTQFLRDGNWRQASAILLRSALSQTASECGFVGVLAEGPALRILAHDGITWDSAANRSFIEGASSRYEEGSCLELTDLTGLLGAVVKDGQAVVANEPGRDPRSRALPPWRPPLRHFLGVPILKERTVLGMVGVANRPGGYAEDERSKLEVLTQAVGLLYDSYRRQQRAAALETERRATVTQLMESRQMYRELVDSLDGIIWEVEAQHFRFTFVSKQCERLLGYSVERWMTEMTWEKLVHPEDLDYVLQTCARAVQEKRNHSLEYRVIAGDDRIVWVRDIATVVVQNDRPVRVIGVLLDITEHKRANERLLTYQKQLRSLASDLERAEERERRRIAEDLHDRIGQALAIARIKLSEIVEMASGSELAHPLGELRRMIDETVLESRTLLFELSPPVLHELGLAAAVEWLIEKQREQYGLAIEWEDDRRPKPLDHDARTLLFKAIRELLMNVVKHAQARRAIVSMRCEANRLRVLVSDDGVGFDVSQWDYRPGRTSGFGLFSVRERLEHQGGQLEIESAVGKGTRIQITFPLGRAD